LLSGFDITPIFLWIVEGKRGRADVEEKLSELRTRKITFWPKHVTHWVSIDHVDKTLADTLAKIRPRSDGGEATALQKVVPFSTVRPSDSISLKHKPEYWTV